jgi:hypothetical protein
MKGKHYNNKSQEKNFKILLWSYFVKVGYLYMGQNMMWDFQSKIFKIFSWLFFFLNFFYFTMSLCPSYLFLFFTFSPFFVNVQIRNLSS